MLTEFLSLCFHYEIADGSSRRTCLAKQPQCIFPSLFLCCSGTACLAVIFYLQPFITGMQHITNGGKADLETPVLLEVGLDTIVRSLWVCLLVEADLLLLASTQEVSWTFHGKTRGDIRKISQRFTSRLAEGKLYVKSQERRDRMRIARFRLIEVKNVLRRFVSAENDADGEGTGYLRCG